MDRIDGFERYSASLIVVSGSSCGEEHVVVGPARRRRGREGVAGGGFLAPRHRCANAADNGLVRRDALSARTKRRDDRRRDDGLARPGVRARDEQAAHC